ncbi:MAG: family 20 glycosylhydrolase, partial [Flavisolibacter sp.]
RKQIQVNIGTSNDAMKRALSILVLVLIVTACRSQNISIIPQPVSVKAGKGTFVLSKKTVIAARDEEDRQTAKLFNDYLKQVYGFTLDINKQEGKNFIRLTTKKFIKAPDKDAYTLNVSTNGIVIDGDTYNGTFYGMQTLIQLLPVDVSSVKSLSIPFVSIEDYPRFAYRGLHLDVDRHFFPIPFVKKYIDYIALHKMNYFHWHLTDDQGWRIEIKKYPRLTTVGGFRNGTLIGRYPGTGNDNEPYGGFYTQEEIKEIVQYAADRHITVIPEIEMPGHASAAIAAYPYLSCFPDEPTKIPTAASQASVQQQADGRKKLVQETWGVFEDVFCAGNDSTFLFLQDVLDEVINLFPSTYIHVGGDESPKENWKRCPKCQARIKQLGLKDEHELQSYFIQRMEKYLNSKGRILIGWDEILEGGLAPNAVVMSWRGEQGGIDAAKQNHQVIMTPGNYVYLDHSQTKNEDSITIGGYTSLEKVYSYEPVPKELSDSQAKFVMGAQGNVWTEYMKYPSKVEYMIFPRLSALSEVLWTPKEQRNWNDFEQRLQTQFKRYDRWKANYSKAYYDLSGQIQKSKNGNVSWVLVPRKKATIKISDPKGRVQYITTDSLEYALTSSGWYTAQQVAKKPQAPSSKDVLIGTPLKINYNVNKATGKNVVISTTPNQRYPGQNGAYSLVNGIYSVKGLSYPDWLGWTGDDLDATIDLGKSDRIKAVKLHTINQNGSWVYLPQYVEVSTSSDGKNFEVAGRSSEFTTDTLTTGWMTVSFPPLHSRYIRLVAKNYGVIAEGKAGSGNKAWLIADEIQVY